MTKSRYWRFGLFSIILSVLVLNATAQDGRDPTVVPADAGSMPGAPGSGESAQSTTVIVQGGKPYLVVGTRLVAVGQRVGAAKLERITETEIWLRDGRQLTKVARFNGIQRSVSKPASICEPIAHKRAGKSAPTPTRPAALKAAAPCEGGQP
jgi:hypothetical protein